jgi:hypothetical protein
MCDNRAAPPFLTADGPRRWGEGAQRGGRPARPWALVSHPGRLARQSRVMDRDLTATFEASRPRMTAPLDIDMLGVFLASGRERWGPACWVSMARRNWLIRSMSSGWILMNSALACWESFELANLSGESEPFAFEKPGILAIGVPHPGDGMPRLGLSDRLLPVRRLSVGR